MFQRKDMRNNSEKEVYKLPWALAPISKYMIVLRIKSLKCVTRLLVALSA